MRSGESEERGDASPSPCGGSTTKELLLSRDDERSGTGGSGTTTDPEADPEARAPATVGELSVADAMAVAAPIVGDSIG